MNIREKEKKSVNRKNGLFTDVLNIQAPDKDKTESLYYLRD